MQGKLERLNEIQAKLDELGLEVEEEHQTFWLMKQGSNSLSDPVAPEEGTLEYNLLHEYAFIISNMNVLS